MTSMLTPQNATIAVLILVVAIACTRLLLRQRGAEHAARSRAWRVALLLIAQPVCAALLYFALWPPTVPGEAGTLVVATAGATAARMEAVPGDAQLALPEAPALSGVARVPDLATALRQHPGTQRVRVVGQGLVPRDRDAVSGIALTFDAAPLPRGLVELDGPDRAAAGTAFRVSGRAEGVSDGFAELLDPARRRVDRVALPADGRFSLSATVRTPGAAAFNVRVVDARQRTIDSVALPLQVEAVAPPRVLLLAGAPGPEVKYLRRWLRDAGLPSHAQLTAGGGVQLGDAPLVVNAGNLARFDVAIVDERAWSALGETSRAALDEAVRNGMGLLVRMTATPSDAERRRLRALGFDSSGGGDTTAARPRVAISDDDATRARIGPGSRDAPRAHDAQVEDVPELTRRTLRLQAGDAVPLTTEQDGTALGSWRAVGRGRVGVWPVTDSYRWVLAGRSDLHGELWSSLVSTLARAQSGQRFLIPGDAREGQRIALCGVDATASVIAPDGSIAPVLRDPATGTRACAAFWPQSQGWHLLRSGERTQAFFVRGASEATGLASEDIRTTTMRLMASAPTTVSDVAAPRHPTARWPWWLAWLLLSGVLWWLERSRLGRR
ncbi:carboxypeptidase regulatory-like domain-containing protein [Lysobacter sp. LF1]|uniref:Carboxypeptidase regulatory-like domain-containing protein n=1 Tax=Lysobacter stagni TaxID=3045172 RepID=A0ABT6XCL4_9GAMM|nr:carboxypeptidase regulatory-like domain-containing protein [Lysobacter sp. LF1]MDI9237665.1 carboxypeptidase regulatory-like domain-containing protein [Lysobacter sp. LF1]